MTSISSLASSSIQSFSQVGQRSGMQPPPPPPDGEGKSKDGGGLLGAIDSALKSAGIEGGLESIFGQSGTNSTHSTDSTSTDSTGTSSDGTTDAASALNSFLQNLISALQSQGTTDSNSEETSDSETGVSTTQGMPPPPPYGRHGMEAKLESLISSLSNGSSATNSSTSDSSAESTSGDLESSLNHSWVHWEEALIVQASVGSCRLYLPACSIMVQRAMWSAPPRNTALRIKSSYR